MRSEGAGVAVRPQELAPRTDCISTMSSLPLRQNRFSDTMMLMQPEQDVNQQSAPPQPVSWSASEYVERHKNAKWFFLALIVVLVVGAAVFLLTRDIVSTVVIGVVGLAFAFFAARPPQVLEYSVDNKGINVGQRSYPYGNFRSFSVYEEDAVRSILLMPARRFGLPLTVHFDAADEEKIVNVLGQHLPFEEREVPAVDRLMTKIHF